MPNYCDNNLIVMGPNAIVSEFLSNIREDDDKLSMLERLIPFPPALRGEEITSGDVTFHAFSARGYDWTLKNWGCKWGDDGTRVLSTHTVDEDTVAVSLVFNTPWGPPAAGMLQISDIYPELTFALGYFETGMVFAGGIKVQNGDVLDEIEVPCPEYDEEFDRYVPSEEDTYDNIFSRLLDVNFALEPRSFANVQIKFD
jgi:hypothetical protein